MNTFGCLDNLAWLWCCELGLSINKHHVGLGPKNKTVRETLPQDLQDRLEEFTEWFDNLYGFRHDLAHQVPFFIPPYIIDTETIRKHNELETQKVAAASAGDFEKYSQLDSQQDSLGKFKAVLAQGPVKSRLYYFHPNMLADFNTIHEIATRLLKALDR